jgi:leucyl aminopeptidase (aminopeptidase T)
MGDIIKLEGERVAELSEQRRRAWTQAMAAYDKAKKEARWAAMKAEDAWSLVCRFADDDFSEGHETEVRQ